MKYFVSGIVCLLLVIAGCKKDQQTTIPQETREEPPAQDTSFQEPRELKIDTSKDASFRQDSLDAAFKREVQRNLKTIYFGYDAYDLSDSAIEKLQTAAHFLEEHDKLRILIEGHCDQRGSTEYNMGLGENRARRVKEYLVNYGIDGIRIEITSWGEERPTVPGCHSESCYAKNRRAEFTVIKRQ
jgi:peptidoglycan-associated lipoprotein